MISLMIVSKKLFECAGMMTHDRICSPATTGNGNDLFSMGDYIRRQGPLR